MEIFDASGSDVRLGNVCGEEKGEEAKGTEGGEWAEEKEARERRGSKVEGQRFRRF